MSYSVLTIKVKIVEKDEREEGLREIRIWRQAFDPRLIYRFAIEKSTR